MSSPLVTVLIPAYNAVEYLSETLASAQGQTFQGLEILVVDDGSRDGTPALVRERMAQDPRLRLIEQPNGGAASARNRGLAEARGRYIAFLDADDLWDPRKLEAQLEVFQREDVGLVHTGVVDIDPAGDPCPGQDPWGPLAGDAFGTLLLRNVICCSSVMVKAEWVCPPAQGFALGRLCEDWLLWGQLAARGRFGYVDRPLVRYRIHPGGTSRNRLAMLEGECYCRMALLDLAKRGGSSSLIRQGRKALFRACRDCTRLALKQGDRPKAWTAWRQGLMHLPFTPSACWQQFLLTLRCTLG